MTEPTTFTVVTPAHTEMMFVEGANRCLVDDRFNLNLLADDRLVCHLSAANWGWCLCPSGEWVKRPAHCVRALPA